MYISCLNCLNALDIKWVAISILLFPVRATVFTRATSLSTEQAQECPRFVSHVYSHQIQWCQMQLDLTKVFFRNFLSLLWQTRFLALPSVPPFYPLFLVESWEIPPNQLKFLKWLKMTAETTQVLRLRMMRVFVLWWWRWMFFADTHLAMHNIY